MEMNAQTKRKYEKFRRLWATQRATVAQIHFVMAYQRAREAAAKEGGFVREHEQIVDAAKIKLWREQAAEARELRFCIFPNEWRELCDLALVGWETSIRRWREKVKPRLKHADKMRRMRKKK